jgi:hypothetical protein
MADESAEGLTPKELDQVAALQQAIHGLVQEQPELPELLFHYTSAQSFLGILETDSMWASHARYLNDRSELVYAVDLMEAAIARRRRRCGATAGRILAATLHGLAHVEASDVMFAASFSEVGDLLSQWRAYGDFGGGYAVGIRAAELDLSGRLRGVAFRPVVYDRQAQMAAVETGLARFCDEDEHPEGGAAEQRSAAQLLAWLTVQASFFKHSSFAEEREWRAVAVLDQAADPGAVNFRATGGVIVPYLDLDMRAARGEQPGRIPLGKIVCGPTLQPDLSRRAVAMALLAHGHEGCGVQVSKVPLRRREA